MSKIISASIDITNYFQKGKSLGAFTRDYVVENLSDDFSNILLNYPVVYVHTWIEDNSMLFYVGETIDMTQRTNEHEKATDKKIVDWHNRWKKAIDEGSKAKSFYFSGEMMNKSLCLDVESELIKRLRQYKCSVNRKDNPQGNYSNMSLKAVIIDEIWNVLISDSDISHFLTIVPVKDSSSSFEWNFVEEESECKTEKLIIKLNKDIISDAKKLKKHMTEEINKRNKDCELFMNYPVVYFHVWKDTDVKRKNDDGIRSYVGETNDIVERTIQHYNREENINKLVFINGEWRLNANWGGNKEGWINAIENEDAYMLVFANRSFNKSMTLDIENRLIQYTIFKRCSVNGRTNEQREYGGKEKMYDAFKSIIGKLNALQLRILPGKQPDERSNASYFPTLEEVKKNSVFMCSPFLKLTEEQDIWKKKITDCICDALANTDNQNRNQVIIVRGGAGTGKTVLVSSLFFSLVTTSIKMPDGADRNVDCHLVVNHKQLSQLYSNMKTIRGLTEKEVSSKQERIWKAQEFLNSNSMPDVVLVDEGHLLNVQGSYGTVKPEQLPQIIERAKVTVLMYDDKQHINSRQLMPGNGIYDWLEEKSIVINERKGIVDLTHQMRMKCSEEVLNWINSLSIDGGEIKPLHNDSNYKLEIVDSIADLENKVSSASKPAALIATYDWEKNSGVQIGEWRKDWFGFGNIGNDKVLEWIEGSTDNVGYVGNIQGFDLLYAGVILGPSVQYRDGKIVFRKKWSWSGKAGMHRGGLPEGRQDMVSKLIANEVGVLLTRGVEGMFIYACDDELRKVLKEACGKAGE